MKNAEFLKCLAYFLAKILYQNSKKKSQKIKLTTLLSTILTNFSKIDKNLHKNPGKC